MAYNETLANRIRERFMDLPEVEEKAMMGGIAFMLHGKMCVGVIKDELMCRIDKAFHDEAIQKQGCRTMDFTHRPMIGYVLVDDSGLRNQREFDYWIDLALAFNPRAKASKGKKKK